ncbi:hypothetical protein WAI453_005452 [Rhynchosporium graminicola]
MLYNSSFAWYFFMFILKCLPQSLLYSIDWRRWFFFAVGVFGLGFSYLIIDWIMALRKAQHKALHFSVEGANDNTWGYGQTTAVFLWAPFLLDAIREKIAHNNKLRADIVAESAIELDDLQGHSAEQPWTSSDALTTDTEI